MSIEKIIPVDKELVNIFGVNDQNLKYLKDKFKKIKINVKGNVVYISGDNGQTTDIMKILDEMLSMAERGEIIEIEDLKLMSNIESKDISNISSSNNISIIGSKAIKVKNVTQFKYIETIENSTITFGIGPAGTGKTFVALYLALRAVFDDHTPYDKIYIVRSLVATREIGFLPGDHEDKSFLYQIPYKQMVQYMFEMPDDDSFENLYNNLKVQDTISFWSTSFIRGTTLDRSIVIVDECQNLNFHELDSIMTRVGEDTKIMFCGDALQSDLVKTNERNGVYNFLGIIRNMEEFGVTEFGIPDIVRSGLIRSYLIAKINAGL